MVISSASLCSMCSKVALRFFRLPFATMRVVFFLGLCSWTALSLLPLLVVLIGCSAGVRLISTLSSFGRRSG